MRPKQNGRYVADNIFNFREWKLLNISFNDDPINNKPESIQIMA